jgi:hypothetical protein
MLHFYGSLQAATHTSGERISQTHLMAAIQWAFLCYRDRDILAAVLLL